MVHFSSSFSIVVAVAFQSTFHLEMYWNNIFLFLKILFSHQYIKTIWKHEKILIWSKKFKNLNFFKSTFKT